MTTVRQIRRDSMVLSEKVQGRHQDRLAIVYVRQSTLRQVEQHQESTRLQYALVNRPGFAGGRFAWVTPPWRGPQAEHSSAPRPRQGGVCRSARGGPDCCTSPPTRAWRTRPPPCCAKGRAGGSPRS